MIIYELLYLSHDQTDDYLIYRIHTNMYLYIRTQDTTHCKGKHSLVHHEDVYVNGKKEQQVKLLITLATDYQQLIKLA